MNAPGAEAKAAGSRGKQSLRLWLRLLACENLIEQTVRTRLRVAFDEHAGNALTMSQLSQKLMVSNGNVTGVVDRLERDGLVRRRASSTDRRVQYIELTEQGVSLFRDIASEHERWIENLLGDLSANEIKALIAGLGKAKDSIAARLATN